MGAVNVLHHANVVAVMMEMSLKMTRSAGGCSLEAPFAQLRKIGLSPFLVKPMRRGALVPLRGELSTWIDPRWSVREMIQILWRKEQPIDEHKAHHAASGKRPVAAWQR